MRAMLAAVFVWCVFGAAAPAVELLADGQANCNVVFGDVFQRSVTLKNNQGEAARVKYAPTALAIGYERQVLGWSAGASLSYETGNAKYDFPDEYAKASTRSLGLTLFGVHQGNGDGFYLKGSLHVSQARQKLTDGWANAGADVYGPNGHETSIRLGASLEVGKRVELPNRLRITPHLGLDFSRSPALEIPYLDNGAPDVSPWGGMNILEIPLGLGLARDFIVDGGWLVTPSLDLTLVTSLGHVSGRNLNGLAGFASRTGSEWKVYGLGANHWGGRISAGVSMARDSLNLGFNYALEVRKGVRDHRLDALVGVAF